MRIYINTWKCYMKPQPNGTCNLLRSMMWGNLSDNGFRKKQHIDILINGRRINHSNEHVIMDKSISFMIQLTGERRWDKCWCVFDTQLKSTVLKKHVKYDEMEHSELKLYISITVQYFFYHPKIHVNYCNLLISI